MAKNVVFDKDRNFNILIFLVAVLIGIFWMSSEISGNSAPSLYLSLWTMVISVLVVIVLFFIRENEFFKKYNVQIPIAETSTRSTAMLIAGIIIAIIFLSLGNLPFLKNSSVGQSITEVTSKASLSFTPLSSFKTTPEAATFSALSTVSDPFFKVFIIGIVAPVIEEFVLGLLFVTIGSLLTLWLLGMLEGILKINISTKSKSKYMFFGGIAFSVVMFVALHSFNNTYSTVGMFVFAGAFRLIINILTYSVKLGSEFGIGIHACNNLFSLGAAAVLAGMFTLGGGITMFILSLLIIYTILNFKKILAVFPRLFKGWS